MRPQFASWFSIRNFTFKQIFLIIHNLKSTEKLNRKTKAHLLLIFDFTFLIS